MLFLGEASNLKGRTLRHIFAIGTKKDSKNLELSLAKRYQASKENVFLTANGRSALCLVLKSLVKKDSKVVINGFTCHAVLEAVKSAGCTPVFADIEKATLNFTPKTLEDLVKKDKNIKAFVIQNTFGNPVDIQSFEKIAKKHNLVLIEDLAHCTGTFYPDGREVGSVGDAVALSFGKGKSLDTTTGGALIFKTTPERPPKKPEKRQKLAQTLRARFYPFFGVLLRASFRLHLNKFLAGGLLKLCLIERSADAPLDLASRPAHWQSKLVLKQLNELKKTPLRTFDFVENREDLLKKLRKSGFVFDEFWYETPVAPARYYQKSGFDEELCPVATEVSKTIINLPTWYSKFDLKPALKIIEEHKHGNLG